MGRPGVTADAAPLDDPDRTSGWWWVFALLIWPPVCLTAGFSVWTFLDGDNRPLLWLVGIALFAGSTTALLAYRERDRYWLAFAGALYTAIVPITVYGFITLWIALSGMPWGEGLD